MRRWSVFVGILIGCLPVLAHAQNGQHTVHQLDVSVDRAEVRAGRETAPKNFLGRFLGAYIEGVKETGASESVGPELIRRLPPAPFASPPFPMSEHIGPTIGTPDPTPRERLINSRLYEDRCF